MLLLLLRAERPWMLFAVDFFAVSCCAVVGCAAQKVRHHPRQRLNVNPANARLKS